MPNFIYCHGFASSPGSSKAQFFRQKLAERGHTLHIPDLNVPSFERLTLTAMLATVAEVVRPLPPEPTYLIGSSMGGAVALHFTERYRAAEAAQVAKLMLLAPGFNFAENRRRQLGDDGLARWRESGWWTTHHYGYGADRRVHFGLYEDAQQYDAFAVRLGLPLLIFHGKGDTTVPYRDSLRFAQTRPDVELRIVDSDHQLLDQTDAIWARLVAFFGI